MPQKSYEVKGILNGFDGVGAASGVSSAMVAIFQLLHLWFSFSREKPPWTYHYLYDEEIQTVQWQVLKSKARQLSQKYFGDRYLQENNYDK